jgi:hypothetical protein
MIDYIQLAHIIIWLLFHPLSSDYDDLRNRDQAHPTPTPAPHCERCNEP